MKYLNLAVILVPTLKHWYAYQMVYPLTIGLVKFSILTQYYRIFEVKHFRVQVIAVGVFVMLYTIICVFVNVGIASQYRQCRVIDRILFPQAFECHSKPWRAWDPSFPAGCNNLNATYYSTASISIFTDLVILLLPLPQLMKLNIHRRRKCMSTSIATERV